MENKDNIEIPNELKALLQNADMSENEMKDILKEFNIKFYGKKNDIIKEFSEGLVNSNIEKEYSYLKKHYLSVKNEHGEIDDSNESITYKYIYHQISPKLNLEMNNNQINQWVKDIEKFGKKELKAFCVVITSGNEDFGEITNKFFFDNYINKDGIPVIHAGFYLAYRDMFKKINEEFIKFLENKIK